MGKIDTIEDEKTGPLDLSQLRGTSTASRAGLSSLFQLSRHEWIVFGLTALGSFVFMASLTYSGNPPGALLMSLLSGIF
jgi:hypothetical protein